jgi:YfiH family protein
MSLETINGVYKSQRLLKYKGLFHGFASRALGNMSVTWANDPKDARAAQWAFLNRLGSENSRIVTMPCDHGVGVGIVDENILEGVASRQLSFSELDALPKNVDALVTNVAGVALLNTYADCMPIFIFDPKRHAVGLVHAGWRSTVGGIIGNTIDTMRKAYSTSSEDLEVYVGPSMGDCCFEIQDDVKGQFKAADIKTREVRGAKRMFVNLRQIALRELVEKGVREGKIEISQDCTCCNAAQFFSHRRWTRKQEPTRGAQAGVIGLEF